MTVAAAPRVLFWALLAAVLSSAAASLCKQDPSSAQAFCGLPYELSNFQGNFKCDKQVFLAFKDELRLCV